MSLPDGTVTFLRSDIEGSMRLARSLGARYDELNAQHAVIVRAAVEAEGGQVVRTEGDAFFVVFTDAGAAARAAVAIERGIEGHGWPEGHPIRVRIGIHTGMATRAGDDYGGFEVSRAARIAALGHGGQVVVSDAARALIAADLPDGWALLDLGRHRLRGVPEPEAVFQLAAPGLARDFPELRSDLDAARHLPTRLGSFIGREDELDALGRLLGANRLLTLTGPGGTGKTTLALELARRHATHLRDGTWFVDLQSVRDPDLVKGQLALGLGLYDGPAGAAVDRLDDYVAERRMLVVIDNFEQVIEAAPVVARLLERSPGTRVIVTSRVALRLSGEQEYAVQPLDVVATEDGLSECARLFVDRARHVRPDLAFDAAAIERIESICGLLDGLPLGIELAAARAGALPLPLIHDRLAARLPLPGSGPRDLPERQRTVEAAVAWSYDLLEPALQRLLARLSVFVGSFDYEQAEAVCGPADQLGIDVLDGLVALVERSLLARIDDPSGGLRFAMLETVGSFAAGRLPADEAERLRERHARAFATLADEWFDDFVPQVDRTTIARAAPDARNVQAACRWALDHDAADVALGLAARTWRLWQRTGRLTIGRELVESALAMPETAASTAARIRVLSALGGLAYWSNEMGLARSAYEEELRLAQREGDIEGQADGWFNLIFMRSLERDLDGAREAMEQAGRLYGQIGGEDADGRVVVAWALVQGFRLTSAPDAPGRAQALSELEASMERIERLADPMLRSASWAVRSMIAMVRGDFLTAARVGINAFRRELDTGDIASALTMLQIWMPLITDHGLPEVGAVVYAVAENGKARYGVQTPAGYSQFDPTYEPLTRLRELLEPAVLERALSRGRTLSLEAVIDELEEAVEGMAGAAATRSAEVVT